MTDRDYASFLNNHSPDDGLVKLALEDIQKSGLSAEILEKAQVRIFNGNSEDLKVRLGRASLNGHSLIGDFRLIELPHFNETGDIVLSRYKIIPTTKNTDGREVKYLHPVGKPAIPYILPEVWQVKDKPHKPLWIVEGEKKGLILIQHDRYAIAVAGVWNFRAGAESDLEGDKELWQELQAFDWRSRTVYLGFDMDLWVNPQVRRALYALAFTLNKNGAIIKIPTWTTGKGIDDHLVYQHTPDANNFYIEPDEALSIVEAKAKKLFDFIDPDHIDEIISALHLYTAS